MDKCESKSKGSGIEGSDEEEAIGYDEKELGLEMGLEMGLEWESSGMFRLRLPSMEI